MKFHVLYQLKKYWKIIFLIFLVILCVSITYLLSKSKNSFANKQFKYGIYIYTHDKPNKLKSLLTYIQLLSNKTSFKQNMENTFIYILDNHSNNDENNITTIIEGYDIKIYNDTHINIKKERGTSVLNTRDCILKGYTFLYPKCKYIMHIDVDNFDINDMYELTDISSINNFYLDGQDYSKIYCNRNYSLSYFSRDIYTKVVDVITSCSDEINGDIINKYIDMAGIGIIDN
jgi:hypothetical protein